MRPTNEELVLIFTALMTTSSWSQDDLLVDKHPSNINQTANQQQPRLKRLKSNSSMLLQTALPTKNNICIHLETKDQFYTLLESGQARPYILIDPSISLTHEDMKVIESWLTNPTVKHVILDNRDEYKKGGDSTIRKNMRVVNPWLEKLDFGKKASLSETELYKLVLLPLKKAEEDLVYGMSYYPVDWLKSMYKYHLKKVSISFDSDPLLEG